jgi:plasmid rolling circle replication initiator protein Rep
MIDNKWDKKKKYELQMFDIYQNISLLQIPDSSYYQKKASLLKTCGTYLKFLECPHCHKEATHLQTANFCKNRLCPMCQWRRSLFIYRQFLIVAHQLQKKYPDSKYVFITLSRKNVPASVLSSELTHYIKSFYRLSQLKIFKKSISGTFRTLEVTYNPIADTYHLHLHIIGVVNKSYFTGNRDYISQKKMTDLWQKAVQVDYTPIVDIRKVRPRKKNQKTVLQEVNQLDNDLSGAAAEVAKYSVKFNDIFEAKNKEEVVQVLDGALKNRRLIGYTGIMKEAYQQLKLKDVDSSDLVNIDEINFDEKCECSICKSELIQVQYLFDFLIKKYVPSQEKESKL